MRKLLSLMLALCLMATLTPAVALDEFGIVGEWMWSSTLYDAGADGAQKLFSRAADMGVTDVYLLVKGTLGTVSFNNTDSALAKSYEDRDVLQEAIDAAHANGIRLHAWITSSNDSAYKAAHPESGLFHFVRGRDNDIVDMTNQGFIAYMKDVLTDLCTNYDIDGLHLDYIRYNHLCNGWSEVDLAALTAMGADVNHIKQMINKTFYDADADANFIFNALSNGDKDAQLLAQYRGQNVVNFAKEMIAAARAAKPELIVTAAMMPDGAAADTAFADLHYGQRYADAAELYDYILPMAYSADYGRNAAWVADVVKNAIRMGNKVVCGLQSYYPATSGTLMDDVEAVRALLGDESLLGIVHFRSSTFQYVKVTASEETKTMDIKLVNTMIDTPLQKVEVVLQDGLTAVSGALTEGFAAAEGVVSEDKTTVTFAAETLLLGDTAGTMQVTFDGQLSADKPAALVRVYAGNETRAYHVYEFAPVAP